MFLHFEITQFGDLDFGRYTKKKTLTEFISVPDLILSDAFLPTILYHRPQGDFTLMKVTIQLFFLEKHE